MAADQFISAGTGFDKEDSGIPLNSDDQLVECVVEYDYHAELNDELTLRIGDVITQVQRLEGGWWKGQLRGKDGMFPDNFVKVLPSVLTSSGSPMKSDEMLLRNKKKCRVLFSYVPVHDDELELKVDQVIDFLCEVEDGWWKGRSGGRVGVFPSNFVELLNSGPNSETSEESLVEAKNKKNAAFTSKGLAMASAKEKENEDPSLDNDMKTSERQQLNSKAPAPDTAPRLPPKPVKEQCLVLFPYQAQNEDELTLEEGQVINIVTRDVEDKGWWKGELNGKTGVFPDNFVKLLVSHTEPHRPNDGHVKKTASQSLSSSVNKGIAEIFVAPGKVNEKRSSQEKLFTRQHSQDKTREKTKSKEKLNDKIKENGRSKENLDIGVHGSSFVMAGSHERLSDSSVKKTDERVGDRMRLSRESLRKETKSSGNLQERDKKVKDRRVSEPIHSSVETEKDSLPLPAIMGPEESASSSAPILSHPTAGRVKAPKRRPPSQQFLKENIPDVISLIENAGNGDETDGTIQAGIVQKRTGEANEKKSTEVLKNSTNGDLPNGKPSWLEELSRKQANRKSGIFSNEKSSSTDSVQNISNPLSSNSSKLNDGAIRTPSVDSSAAKEKEKGEGLNIVKSETSATVKSDKVESFVSQASANLKPVVSDTKPNISRKPNQSQVVKTDDDASTGVRKVLGGASFKKPEDKDKSDLKPGRPAHPPNVSKVNRVNSLATDLVTKTESRKSGGESVSRRATTEVVTKTDTRKPAPGQGTELTRKASDCSKTSNSDNKALSHSTNLGKPDLKQSFTAKPERPLVTPHSTERPLVSPQTVSSSISDKLGSNSHGSGPVIGWRPDLLNKKNSPSSSQEEGDVAHLQAELSSLRSEFQNQMGNLSRELEEERQARIRLETEVKALRKLLEKK